MNLSRGLRINNPGNIRPDYEIWKGEQFPSLDSSFKTFKTMEYGYRAMAIDLYSKVVNDGVDTISKIITKYAPPSDGNDTAGYITFVANGAGISPDQVLTNQDFLTPTGNPLMKKIVSLIELKEQGVTADSDQLNTGYEMFVADRL